MEDDIDYSELNNVEFGYNQYVFENDLGKLVVKGDSRVFSSKEKDEEDKYFFRDTQKMTWYDIEELAENGDEQAKALIEARNKIRSYHHGRTNS